MRKFSTEKLFKSVIWIAALLTLARFLRRHPHVSSCGRGEESNGQLRDRRCGRPRSLSYKYQNYLHPSEEEHRTAEQFNWRNIFWLNVSLLGSTIAGAVFAALAYSAAKTQADVASNQFSLAFPPKLSVYAIHMWEKGRGSAFNAEDQLPQLIDGKVLEGVVFIANKGREAATLQDSSFVVDWRREKINMFNPIWNSAIIRPLKSITSINLTSYSANSNTGTSHLILPEGIDVWEFTTKVDYRAGSTLYLFGRVIYKDRTNTQHDLAFTRRYDPKRGRFVRADDATEDTENEEPLPDPSIGK